MSSKSELLDYPSLSAFDLDKTLLTCNSSFLFGWYLFEKRVFSLSKMLKLLSSYYYHQKIKKSLFSLHQSIFDQLFRGKKQSFFEEYADQFLDEKFDKMRNHSCLKEFEHARKRGDYLLILSNSPQFLVEKIGERLGAHKSIGTFYQTDLSNCFSAIQDVFNGREKADYLLSLAKKLKIPKKHLYAYSDSIHDLPLLESVGNPVAVNPDTKLLSLSKKNQWQVLLRDE